MIFPDRNLHSFAMSQLAMFDQRVRPALTLALRPPIFIQLFGACSCWLSEVNSAHQRRPLRPLRKLWLRNRPSHVSLGLLNTLSSKRLADPTLIWGILTTLLSPKKNRKHPLTHPDTPCRFACLMASPRPRRSVSESSFWHRNRWDFWMFTAPQQKRNRIAIEP